MVGGHTQAARVAALEQEVRALQLQLVAANDAVKLAEKERVSE
jgi:hypothetical protein